MIRSISILTVVIIIMFIILMALPDQWHAKTAGTIGVLSVVLVAYGIYSAGLDLEENFSKQSDPNNDAIFIDMQRTMISNPEMQKVYKEIYGSQFEPNQHALIMIMAVRMQQANDYYDFTKFGYLPHNNNLITVLKAWANCKSFREMWPTIRKFYKPHTDTFIKMLQS